MTGQMAAVKRREKAEATRRAIVKAAHAEFLESGFHGATVTTIATRARVAPQTIYFVFGTKPQLISAVIDAAVMGERDEDPASAEWFEAVMAEPDPAQQLRAWVAGAADIFERAAGVSEVMRAAALTDDEVRTTFEKHEALQREGFRAVVESVAQKAALRPGLTVDTALDVMLTLLGDSTWHQLRTTHGWSRDQVVEWLSDALPRLLLAD